jgi:hypothetical protein
VSDRERAHIAASSVVRFIGDLHLGDGAKNDAFGDKDELLAGLLAECAGTSDAVVFMGDAIDVPQALSARRAARAHPLAMRAIEALSRRTRVVFIRGIRRFTGTDRLPKRGGPSRFACAMGAVWLVATAWSFWAGHAALGYGLGVSLTGVAALVATTDICIPSMMYRLMFGPPKPRLP